MTGEVTFTKSGDITLRLITEEQYKKSRDDDDEKEEKKGSHDFAADKDIIGFLILKVGKKELERKKVVFAFTNVPEGIYVIESYQDVNGNGELDEGKFGPKDPWGTYRPKRPFFRGPKFKEVKFEVIKIIREEDTRFAPPKMKYFALTLKDGSQLAVLILDKAITVETSFNPSYQINVQDLYEVVLS